MEKEAPFMKIILNFLSQNDRVASCYDKTKNRETIESWPAGCW